MMAYTSRWRWLCGVLLTVTLLGGCGDASKCGGFFQACEDEDASTLRVDVDAEDQDINGTVISDTESSDPCMDVYCPPADLVPHHAPAANFMAASSVIGAGPYRLLGQLSPALIAVGHSASAQGGYGLLAGTPSLTSGVVTEAPIPAGCGDNIAQSAEGEACDGVDLGAVATCDLLGFGGETSAGISCDATCNYNTSNCREDAFFCGNTTPEPSKGEDCDPNDPNPPVDVCTLMGFDQGDSPSISCLSSCQWDLSTCAFHQNEGVSTGLTHTCALAKDISGTAVGVECWGDNRAGQLESGPSAVGLSEVLVGSGFSCGRGQIFGQLVCWGGNASQLVPGPDATGCDLTTTPCPAPLSALRVTDDGFCALAPDGSLACGNLPSNPINASAIMWPTTFDLSAKRLCVVDADLSIMCIERGAVPAQGFTSPSDLWEPTTDKLLVGENSLCAFQPPLMTCWSATNTGTAIDLVFLDTSTPYLFSAADIFGDRVCAFDGAFVSATDSGVRCWFANLNVDPSLNPALDPIGFDLTGGTGIVTNLSLGDGLLCMDTLDGVRCAETNSNPANGIRRESRYGQQIPPYVHALGLALAPLGDRACLLKDLNGAGFARLVCWGPDAPTATAADANWTGVSLSDADLCLLRADGTVKCATQDVAVPGSLVDWTSPPGVLLKQVSVGLGAACGVSLADGSLVCWDQTGAFPLGFDPAPAGVAFEKVETFLGGGWCGISADGFVPGVGTLRCSPSVAQSLGAPERSSVPIYRDVSLSEGYGCAVRGNGWIDCWGSRPGEPQNDPSKPAVAVDVSFSHACALLADGTLDCWGALPPGLDVTSNRAQGLTAVHVGAAGVCATRRNNELVCWGYNHSLGHR